MKWFSQNYISEWNVNSQCLNWQRFSKLELCVPHTATSKLNVRDIIIQTPQGKKPLVLFLLGRKKLNLVMRLDTISCCLCHPGMVLWFSSQTKTCCLFEVRTTRNCQSPRVGFKFLSMPIPILLNHTSWKCWVLRVRVNGIEKQ